MDLVVPDPSKSIAGNAIEPWSKPHYRSQLAELKRAAEEAQAPARRALVGAHRRGKVVRHRGRTTTTTASAASSGGSRRKKYKVHVRVFLSRYRGYLTVPGLRRRRLRREARDVRVAGRTIDQVSALTVREAQGFFATLDSDREGSGDRREGAEGDSPASVVPERRRPRLPDARPAVVDAFGRRGAAHQSGDLARLRAGRHALRARRAVDRPPLARQPSADRHPAPAPRPGQHRPGGRARRRHDQGRRSHRRSGSRRRRAGRARRLFRDARGPDAGAALADVEVSAAGAGDSGPDGAAARLGTEDSPPRRERAQPEGHRRRHSAERADVRDRRQRLRQIDARARRACTRRSSARRAAGTSGSARSGSSRAASSSPTWCWSIRRPSDARRARTR